MTRCGVYHPIPVPILKYVMYGGLFVVTFSYILFAMSTVLGMHGRMRIMPILGPVWAGTLFVGIYVPIRNRGGAIFLYPGVGEQPNTKPGEEWRRILSSRINYLADISPPQTTIAPGQL
jgi:hypothetical protein